MIEIGTRHWSIALGTALVTHVILLALIQKPWSSGAMSTGVRGIKVSLGPTGSALGSLPASAVRPTDARTVVPSKPPVELISVNAPEVRQVTASSIEAVRPLPTRAAVTVRRPLETQTVVPDEASSEPPEGVVAAISPEAVPPTTQPAVSVMMMRKPPETQTVVPASAVRPTDARTVVPSKPPVELISVNAPEVRQVTASSIEAVRPLPTRAAVTVRRPPETQTVVPDEASSEPPEGVVAAISPEAVPPTTQPAVSVMMMRRPPETQTVVPASAVRPTDARTVVPSKPPVELIFVNAPEVRQVTASSIEAVRPLPTRAAVTVRRPLETQTVVPDEASSEPPEGVVAAISPEAVPPTTQPAVSVMMMRKPPETQTVVPASAVRPTDARTVVPSKPPVELISVNAPEVRQVTASSIEAVRPLPTRAAVTVRRPLETQTVVPDEASSEPPLESEAANEPVDPHLMAAAEPTRVVPAGSIETAQTVRTIRQAQPVTAAEKLEVLDAKPEESTIVYEVLPAKEVTPPNTEPSHAKPSEEVTARQEPGSVATDNGRPAPEHVAKLAPGSATPGAAADYYTRLQAWLEQHKRYPRRARLLNKQGVVLLRFVVTRGGEVSSFAIEKSSGHSYLDEAARKMVQRALPLPKIPPELLKDRLEFLLPVQFFLQ